MKTYLCIVLTAFMIAVWGHVGLQEVKKYHFMVKKDKLRAYAWKVHNRAFRLGWNVANSDWKNLIRKRDRYTTTISGIKISSRVTQGQIFN